MVDSPLVMLSNILSHHLARRPAVRLAALAIAALPLAVFLPSCSLPDDTAALVNEKPVAAADLERSYEDFLSQYGEMLPPGGEEAAKVRKALLDRLVDEELMLQEASRLGLVPTAEESAAHLRQLQGELNNDVFASVLAESGLDKVEWEKRVLRDFTLERLQEKAVFGSISVGDDEIAAYAAQHRNTYEKPEEVRASQILVKTREEAREAAKRIKKGAPFDVVAGEVSLSPDAEKGGDLGYFSRGQMPQEFDAVVFSLPKGKLSSVVETTYGHHLFLVTDRREALKKSEGEIVDEVRALLLAEKREEFFSVWLENLRSKASLRYNEDTISP